MNTVRRCIALAFFALAGCQTVSQPAPGLSTLRLSVIAEPKTGAVIGNNHVLSYDSPGSASGTYGKFEKVDYFGLDDIVIWLEPAARATTQIAATKIVNFDIDPDKPREGLSGVVCPGEQIVFQNVSPVSLILYSVSDGNDFDLGMVQPRTSAIYTVQSIGEIEVLTDTKKDPVAEFYSAATPQARITHAGQTVIFADLPAGEYKITSWHPRLPGRVITVTLPANQITDAAIKVGVNDLPKIAAP